MKKLPFHEYRVDFRFNDPVHPKHMSLIFLLWKLNVALCLRSRVFDVLDDIFVMRGNNGN